MRSLRSQLAALPLLTALASLGGVGGAGCGGDGDGDGSPDASVPCSETADTCSGETVCLGGACVVAFPRVYAVSNVQHTVPATRPDGSAWDSGGTPPDLLLQISVNGVIAHTTPSVPDSLTASFVGPFNLELIAGSSLILSTYDEDPVGNDPAYSCQSNPVSLAQLRARVIACNSPGYVLQVRIEPQGK